MNKTTLNSQKEKYSMLSLRRATALMSGAAKETEISIHALLAESDHGSSPPCLCSIISIHALLAESDFTMLQTDKTYTVISIHALLAESDARPCKEGIRP